MKTLKFNEFALINEIGDLRNITPFDIKHISGNFKDVIVYEFYVDQSNRKPEEFWCELYPTESTEEDEAFFEFDEVMLNKRRKANIKVIYEISFSSLETGFDDKKFDLKTANRVLATIFEIIKAVDDRFSGICYTYEGTDDRRQKYYTAALNKLAEANKYAIATIGHEQILFFKK